MKGAFRFLLVMIAIALVGALVYPRLCHERALWAAGPKADSSEIQALIQQKLGEQPAIDEIDGVPDLSKSLEDIVNMPQAKGGIIRRAWTAVKNLWNWVTALPHKLKRVWNWTDQDSSDYRDRIFVSGGSKNSDKAWDRTRYLRIVQSAAVVDCQDAGDACQDDGWYIERSTKSWRRAIDTQIDKICPRMSARWVCGESLCGVHAMVAKTRATTTAVKVWAVERLHATLHWFGDKVAYLKHHLSEAWEWGKHAFTNFQNHYDELGTIE